MEQEGFAIVYDDRHAKFMRDAGVTLDYGPARHVEGNQGRRSQVCCKHFAPPWAVVVFEITGSVEPERTEVESGSLFKRPQRKTNKELRQIKRKRTRMFEVLTKNSELGEALVTAFKLGGVKAALAMFPNEVRNDD